MGSFQISIFLNSLIYFSTTSKKKLVDVVHQLMEQSNEEAEVSIARRLIAQIETAESNDTTISEKTETPLSDRGVENSSEETEESSNTEVVADATPGNTLSTAFAKVE